LALIAAPGTAAAPRQDGIVAGPWRSILYEADSSGRATGPSGLERPGLDDRGWAAVSVPHNWQGYAYARQVVRGSRHGTAWYRTHVTIAAPGPDERISLRFEGAAAYATIWLNGRLVGRHAGGLTSFTVDVTEAVRAGDNLLAVRTDNPAHVEDLPWTAGDDQTNDAGCCEGSQPFGLFRPVHLVRGPALRVRPFGLYAWGELGSVDRDGASLTTRSEIENRSARVRSFELVAEMVDADGRVVAEARSGAHRLRPGEQARYDLALARIARPSLWSPDRPYLYSLRARLIEDGRVVDESRTPYGIRTFEIRTAANGNRRLYLNGEPFFVRGVAEYEHLLGGSHAFSTAQVEARVAQAEAAGFNAFRDGHYPHNLAYGDRIARDGLLWWPQFSAHLWFDNPAFRSNFKALLADWVRERRNNPAIFLWGLQNESRLPKAFAEEAVALIRELDPTASKQRLVTTCNGGEGTDWNVPQNWSGTYGGDPSHYGDELVRQGLVGEYGAWRSLELHSEPPFGDKPLSETRMAALMQQKAQLAGTVADRSVGDFQWLLATHENPGRPMRADGTQIWDGVRELDHVGPANNKGLMTLWGEPLDVYYMYRARQVPASRTPIVYIVSHTWPDRWTGPGPKSGIEVYSNCDSVELFNDATGHVSLGRRNRDPDGRWRWDAADLRYDIVSASCLVDGVVKARDAIRLNNLPAAPDAAALVRDPAPIGRGDPARHYLYRVNVGGGALTDASGHRWLADRHLEPGGRWGWRSWADRYPDLDPQLGSRRKTFDAIEGTDTQGLFQTFRYGREALSWRFAVPNGRYRVELYFVEPWYGRTGIDARGWRRFDVAVNGKVAIRSLDIFAEAGFNRALRKVVDATVRNGRIVIDFPRVEAGQAIIAGIAISSARSGVSEARADGTDLVRPLDPGGGELRTYLDNGDLAFGNGGARWTKLSPALLDSDWVRPGRPGQGGTIALTLRVDAELYLPVAPGGKASPGWETTDLDGTIAGGAGAGAWRFARIRKRGGERVAVPAGLPVLVRRALVSPYAPGLFSFARDPGLHEAEARDAKPVNARLQTLIKGYGGQGYLRFDAGPGSVVWPVETGVAGRHDFVIRYALPPGLKRDVRLVLRDSSGIDVAVMPIALAGGEGWQQARAETPTMVNAGRYALRLEAGEGAALAVDSIRIQ
jgi:hypothetical protein